VLTKALAQAFQWRELLATGAAKSLQQVATQSDCDENHVRHQIGLAFLAPDIVEMIVGGSQPRHITLDRLVRCELPASWPEQRRLLGLAAR
jgi:site-specific DNA recombinase